jgi:hypothetical protein
VKIKFYLSLPYYTPFEEVIRMGNCGCGCAKPVKKTAKKKKK